MDDAKVRQSIEDDLVTFAQIVMDSTCDGIQSKISKTRMKMNFGSAIVKMTDTIMNLVEVSKEAGRVEEALRIAKMIVETHKSLKE